MSEHDLPDYEDAEGDPPRGNEDCPVCGVRYKSSTRHQCDPKKLAAIDRAHTGAADAPPIQREPGEYRRLKQGFTMLDEDEDISDVPCYSADQLHRPLTRPEWLEWRKRNSDQT